MHDFQRPIAVAACLALATILGCTKGSPEDAGQAGPATQPQGSGGDIPAGGGDHSHDEVPLGTAMLGSLAVECGQGHGTVAPGKEMHLVVKLPYNDQGASVVRAWIGTEDRLGSRVAKGIYASSHDDYDIHAEAPDPLPANAKWWVEVEQPDGTKQTGSIAYR